MHSTTCCTPSDLDARAGAQTGKQSSKHQARLNPTPHTGLLPVLLQRIRQWLGPRLPGPWRWHTLAEAEAYLLALEDDDD